MASIMVNKLPPKRSLLYLSATMSGLRLANWEVVMKTEWNVLRVALIGAVAFAIANVLLRLLAGQDTDFIVAGAGGGLVGGFMTCGALAFIRNRLFVRSR